MYWKSKVLRDAKVKLCRSFFLVTRTMQVLFVLRFYHPDKTDKIDRLIHDSSSKMAVKISSLVKKQMYVLFRVTAGNIHSFRIRSKETPRIMYPKYPIMDMIQRIHLRCGSFGSIIRFGILIKKRNIRNRIKNPHLDFSKETHPELLYSSIFFPSSARLYIYTPNWNPISIMINLFKVKGGWRILKKLYKAFFFLSLSLSLSLSLDLYVL